MIVHNQRRLYLTTIGAAPYDRANWSIPLRDDVDTEGAQDIIAAFVPIIKGQIIKAGWKTGVNDTNILSDTRAEPYAPPEAMSIMRCTIWWRQDYEYTSDQIAVHKWRSGHDYDWVSIPFIDPRLGSLGHAWSQKVNGWQAKRDPITTPEWLPVFEVFSKYVFKQPWRGDQYRDIKVNINEIKFKISHTTQYIANLLKGVGDVP